MRRANAIVWLSRQAGMLTQARAGCLLRDAFMRATPVGVQLRRRERILALEPPTIAA